MPSNDRGYWSAAFQSCPEQGARICRRAQEGWWDALPLLTPLPLQEHIVVVPLHALGCDLFVLLQQPPDGITQSSVQTTFSIKSVCLTLCSCKTTTGTDRVRSFSSVPKWSLNKHDFCLLICFTVVPSADEHIDKNWASLTGVLSKALPQTNPFLRKSWLV